MFKKIAEKFVKWQIQKGYLLQLQYNAMSYSYEMLIMQCANFLIALLIGIVFRQVSTVLIFLLFYIPLRSYAGGVHADKNGKCMLYSASIIIIVCIMMPILLKKQLYILMLCLLELVAIIIFVITVPVQAEGKLMTRNDKERCRKRFFRIFCWEVVVIILFRIFERSQWMYIIFLAHVILCILLIAGLFKSEKNR